MKTFDKFTHTIKLGDYSFGLGELKGISAENLYYVTIRNKNGDLLTDTIFSYKFQNKEEAAAFCQDVADNKITVEQIIQKNRDTHKEIRKQIDMNEAIILFESFLKNAQSLGVDVSKLPQIFKAYDNLSDRSRSFLRSDEKIEAFLRSNPAPVVEENKTITFGEWLDISRISVDVCLVDKDAEEHFLSSVSYIDPEDIEDGIEKYSPFEEWLRGLPVDKAVNNGNSLTLCVLRSDYNTDQIEFLLGDETPFGSSAEWVDLYNRAAYASASFEARLDYMLNGTPFEKLFDGTCMDVVNEHDRNELSKFLAEHEKIYISSADWQDHCFVYAIDKRENGELDFTDCAVVVRETGKGKGFFSTLDGKLCLAKRKENLKALGVKEQDNLKENNFR